MPYNNQKIKLHDNSEAIFYFGNWVDPQSRAKIDPHYYPEILKIDDKKEKKENKKSTAKWNGSLFSLDRKIWHNYALIKNPELCLFLIWLISKAFYEAREYNGEMWKRGEGMTGSNEAIRCLPFMTPKKFRLFLRKLESWQILGTKGAKGGANKGTRYFLYNYNNLQAQNQERGNENGYQKGEERASINNDNNYIKEKIYKKEKINLKSLPDFVIEKMKSKNKNERVLISFFVYSGKCGDFFEVNNYLKQGIVEFYNELQEIKKYPDHEIMETMANVSNKEGFTLADVAKVLNQDKPKQGSTINNLISKAIN